MPPEVRTGIYVFGVAIIGVIVAILAADGSWAIAAPLALSAGIHLMSAILTWRHRRWRIEVEEGE
jgi:membrane protein YdbS with pleckstrin-like domain